MISGWDRTMTDEAHNTRMANIRKSYWLRFEGDDEHEDRANACEASAYRLFKLATVGQQASYEAVLRDNMGDNSPRARWAVIAAKRRWFETTAAARELMADTFEELMRDADMSEETSARWDAMPVYVEMAEVAA
jgi:hypothetical protein